MFPVVIGIAIACALFLESDSPRPSPPREEPHDPPPSDPPSPPPDAGTAPRGINPAIFTSPPPSTWPTVTPWTDVSRELRGQFEQAFELNANNRLVVRDEARATAFRQRITLLQTQALADPRLAEAYDRSEIARYAYLTNNTLSEEQRGLLYRMILGRISILDCIREVDRQEIDHSMGYNGRSDPTGDAFSRRHQIMGDALRQIINPITLDQALRMSAEEVVRGNRLGIADAERTRLAGLDLPSLQREYDTLSREWATRPEGTERRDAFRKMTCLSFLLTSRGQTNALDAAVRDCRARYGQSDDASCRIVSQIHMAADSPSLFDNAHMRVGLLEGLNSYFSTYLGQSTSQRVAQQSLLLDAELGQALTGGGFGAAFSPTDLRGMLQAIETASGRSHIPAARTQPLTMADIQAIGEDPLEVRLSDIPEDWRSMAQQIQVTVPRATDTYTGTLWAYLEANVDTVVFTRHGPQLGADLNEPAGTTNRLMRTVILDIDGNGPRPPSGLMDPSGWTMFGTLAHEAYHNDFFNNHVPQDPNLARATLVNERNAHLFEATVLRETLRIRGANITTAVQNASTTGMTDAGLDTRLDELIALMGYIGTQRLTGLSANIGLEIPPDDDALYSFMPDPSWGVTTETLGRYPTTFTDRYLRRRDMTRERFIQREVESLTSGLGPLAALVRRRASGSPAGTSTAGSH